MKLLLGLFSFFITNLSASFAANVAVIGAGPAGLTAARDLMDLGHNVTVFEKEGRVGGKARTIRVGADLVELGAILTTPYYTIINEFSRRFNIPYTTWPSQILYTSDLQPGLNEYRAFMDSMSWFEIAREANGFRRFKKMVPQLANPILSPVADERSFLSFSDLSNHFGFTQLARVSTLSRTLSGYAFPDTIPALYASKLMGYYRPVATGLIHEQVNPISYDFFRGINYFPTGFQSLWEGVARDMQLKLHTTVTKVRKVGQKLRVASGAHYWEFDKVIVATPPKAAKRFLADSLQLMDFEDVERNMRSVRYFVSVIKTPQFSGKNKSYFFEQNMHSARINHTQGIMNWFHDPNLFVAYQQLDAHQTWESAREMLRSDLAERLGITEINFLQNVEWDYFPHFPLNTISNDLLAKISSMQGVNGIYFVGGAWNFEATETAAANARYVIRELFTRDL